MTRREKLLARLRSPGKVNVRFDEILSLAKHYGFEVTSGGADYILRHDDLELLVFIGKPHGGRDFVRPHDIDRLVDALEELGIIREPSKTEMSG
ncbi:MAG TPA: hypothetical protein VGL40_05570 [Bacillota bacterium]